LEEEGGGEPPDVDLDNLDLKLEGRLVMLTRLDVDLIMHGGDWLLLPIKE